MRRLHFNYLILSIALVSGWTLRYQHHERLKTACTPRDTSLGRNIDHYLQHLFADTHFYLYVDNFAEGPLGYWRSAQHNDSLALALIRRAEMGESVADAYDLFKNALPTDTSFHHQLDTLFGVPLRDPAARGVQLQTARLRLLLATLEGDICSNCCGFFSELVPVVSVEQPIVQPGDTLRANLAVTNLPLWYAFQRQRNLYRLNEQEFAPQQEGLSTSITFPKAGRYPLTFSGAFTLPPFDTTIHLQQTFLLNVE